MTHNARQISEPLAAASQSESGADWWRSLDELADTPEFKEYLHHEFPENADAWIAGSRRDFLKLMGASLALAGLTGCNVKQPKEQIVPVVKAAGHLPPGTSEYFTTAMEIGGNTLGLVVKSEAGRPIKVEGNRQHPTSRGATHIFAQAATLDLYDPDRRATVQRRGAIVPRDAMTAELNQWRETFDQSQGEGLRLLLRPTTSPTTRRLLEQLMQRWPKARWITDDPTLTGNTRTGMMLAFGDDAANHHPVYRFENASVVVSIDCDFLAARERPLSEVADFMSVRRVAGRKDVEANKVPSMVRLFQLESTPSLIGAKADSKLLDSPQRIESVLIEVARDLGVLPPEASGVELPESAQTWIGKVVAALRQAEDSGVVAVGESQPPRVHALAHAINEKLGANGRCVEFLPSPLSFSDDGSTLKSLAEEMKRGEVTTLTVLAGNAAFDAPADIDFAGAISKVVNTLALAPSKTETTELCEWVIPESHFLEGWGDLTAHDGTASIVQPLIQPLHESRSQIEVLVALLGLKSDGYETVRESWPSLTSIDSNGWDAALRTGVIDQETPTPKQFSIAENLASHFEVRATPSEPGKWTVMFRPDPTIRDGEYANNGWLQELPKPLSTLTWDNAAWICPADAESQSLKNGDVIRLSVDGRDVELPVWIMPGQVVGCITLFFGYGRTVGGRVAAGTGVDVCPLRTSDAMWARSDVALAKTGRNQALAATQHHQLMEGRHLARSGTLQQLKADPEHPSFVLPPEAEVDASFYVPAFRTKQDVLPGRYTSLWFEATKPGTYQLFCAEYCGTDHSKMIGSVIVQTPEEYAEWLGSQTTPTAAERGRRLVDSSGCLQCHGADGNRVAPSLNGLFDSTSVTADGSPHKVNVAYIRRAIIDPQAQVRAGYQKLMPSFDGKLTPEQILDITAYLKSVADASGPTAGPGRAPSVEQEGR